MTPRRTARQLADEAVRFEREGLYDAAAQAHRNLEALEEMEARERWKRESRRPADTIRRGYSQESGDSTDVR